MIFRGEEDTIQTDLLMISCSRCYSSRTIDQLFKNSQPLDSFLKDCDEIGVKVLYNIVVDKKVVIHKANWVKTIECPRIENIETETHDIKAVYLVVAMPDNPYEMVLFYGDTVNGIYLDTTKIMYFDTLKNCYKNGRMLLKARAYQTGPPLKEVLDYIEKMNEPSSTTCS